MRSQFVASLALGLLAAGTVANTASAQTALSWGQHITRYGSGYVGNAPNTAPMTAYYRAPVVAGYAPVATAPVTAYYAPASGYPVAQTAYAPGVSYSVGTANAAPYTAGYSPVVTSSTPYAAQWQYPPQTVMPTTANYLPAAPTYTTNYAAAPVTMYRPTTVLSPTGVPQTVLQPCTTSECQAQRKHTGFFGNLFHHNQPAAGSCASGTCASGVCPQPAQGAVPYYTPAPATVLPGPVGASVPANIAPTLSGPPTVTTPSTTITTPGATITGPTTSAPNTFISPNTGTPLSTPGVNSSGAARADYPPGVDVYTPGTTDTFQPNVSPRAAAPITPITPEIRSSTPADNAPMLNGPSNAPIGSGVLETAPSDGGARFQPRSNYNVQSQPAPRASLKRESDVTPIPDPEYRPNTRAKVNKAPSLISPRDKTAQIADPNADARLASFEQEAKPTLPATPPARKIHGDEIWRSAK